MRRFIVGFVVGALLMTAAPVVAVHITEPLHPVDRLDLWVGDYATRERLDCSTIDTFDKGALRVNGYVFSDRPSGDPNEHFDVELTVWDEWDPDRNTGEMLYSDNWGHQNIPPHAAKRWQIGQTQINVQFAPGTWKVKFEVQGRESGRHFVEDCVFEVVPERFTDDDGSVFEDDIGWLAASGITAGCNPPDNDRFCPDDPVTRGQMAAFLNRALGLEPAPDNFTDTSGSIFSADIGALAAAGITRGCNPPNNDRYCPGEVVTRDQMAAFLVRALGYTEDGGGDLFVDDDGSVFEGDIDRLGTVGVTRGCNPPSNDRFCPTDPVTRGQMAAFLRRALGG